MRALAVLALFLVPQLAAGQPVPPRIFFTDLESGPGTGGEDNLGVFVTIAGKGFGASQGASNVTVGGGAVGAYRAWSDTRVVVQLGPAAQTGAVVVQTANGASNGVPFTVRPGNVYFVALGGDDGGAGSFQFPWQTIVHAKDTIAAGDVAYIRDGVSQTVEDNYGAALSIETSGAPGNPKALVAYPGAVALVGSTAPGMIGLRIPNIGIAANDWLIAGIRFRGETNAIELGGTGSTRWRVAGNDISCPVGDGQTGCFAASQTSYLAFLGNDVHDNSSLGPQPSKQYHSVYFTTDTNHVDVGWNHIHDNRTCRAIQFHSSPLCNPDCGPNDTTGFNQYDLVVHDNLIHGDVCDGINFATVDPSQGPVQAYNNVIYQTGLGPDPPDGSANYAGIYVAAGTNTGPDGTGAVEIYNNTLYANGSIGGADAGQLARGPGSPGLLLSLRNNIVYSPAGEDYLTPATQTSDVTGTNNVWFGDGVGPGFLANNVDDDPDFVSAASFDFHLLGTSPALDAAAPPAPATDLDGVPRPQGPGADIGAYERAAAPVPSVSVGDATLLEGDAGSASAAFTVTLSTAASGAVTVAFATADGSASAGSDYTAAAGTLSFAPGSTSLSVGVEVLGDVAPEADETFQLILSGPSGAVLGDAQGLGTIVNDDAPAAFIPLELAHGAELRLDLAADPGPTADVDLFRIRQQPRASYEVVVDATSGDVGNPASPILLDRIAADLSTVLQAAAPIGQGASRSLRWEQPLATAQDFEVVRVRSGSCTVSCDAAAVYRLRAWETTGFVPRFNNSATQVTVLVLENAAAQGVGGTLWFRDAAGSLLGSQAFSVAGRSTFTLNTATVPGVAGASGALTITHTGRYGDLAGKAVSVEPATGFTFDTPMLPRPR